MHETDDMENDDFAILGSRFARVTADRDDRKLGRMRSESDARQDHAAKRKLVRTRDKMNRDEMI